MKTVRTINRKFIRVFLAVIILILTGMLIISCSKKNILEPKETGILVLTAHWPEEPSDSSDTADRVSQSELNKPNDAPSEVDNLEVTVSGPEFSPMSWNFDASSNNGQMDGIPVGSGREVYVSAKDISNNEIYWFRQQDININPDRVTNINVDFLPIAPMAPTGLDVFWDDSSTAIYLGWNDNSNNEDYFVIERKETYQTDFSNLDSVSSYNTEYYDNNYTVGDEYYYRVRARNTGGSSPYSQEFFFSTRTNLSGPTEATTFWYSNTAIAVTWNDNSVNEDSFLIERQKSGEGWFNIGSVAADSTIYIDNSYNMGDEYYYRVIAVNNYGQSDYSNQDYFYTINLPPLEPGIHDSWYNGTSMVVYWHGSSEAGDYIIYRSTDGDAFTNYDSIGNVSGDTVFYDYDTSIEDWYYYKVKASGTYGYSNRSSTDSAYVDNTGPLYFKGTYESTSDCGRIFMDSGYLYVTQPQALMILNTNPEPARPLLANFYNIGASAVKDVAIANNYAFLVLGNDGIDAVNVSNPSSPVFVGHLNLAGYDCKAVTIWDSIAFVGTVNEGMLSINIKIPDVMWHVSTYTDYTNINDIKTEILGDSLYAMCAYGNGLLAINVENPNSMYYGNRYQIGNTGRALFLHNGLACLAAGVGGLQIISYDSFLSMSHWGGYNCSSATGIFCYNNFAFLADGTNGMKIINFDSSPYLLESFPTAGECIDAVYNPATKYLYVSVKEIGIYIFEFNPVF